MSLQLVFDRDQVIREKNKILSDLIALASIQILKKTECVKAETKASREIRKSRLKVVE